MRWNIISLWPAHQFTLGAGTWTRHLDPARLVIAKAEFENIECLRNIHRSSSPRSSLIHMVAKQDGGWRPCSSTTPNRYPVPHIQDFHARLAGKVIFSKVNLVRGYLQVLVHPLDMPKIAGITPFGLIEFFRMPFGLKNAAQTFQRLMDTVLRDLHFFICLSDPVKVSLWADGDWLRTGQSLVTGAVHLCLDYDCMAADQVSDPDVPALRIAEMGLKLEDVAFGTAGTTLLCHVSTGQTQPVVPTGWRRDFISRANQIFKVRPFLLLNCSPVTILMQSHPHFTSW